MNRLFRTAQTAVTIRSLNSFPPWESTLKAFPTMKSNLVLKLHQFDILLSIFFLSFPTMTTNFTSKNNIINSYLIFSVLNFLYFYYLWLINNYFVTSKLLFIRRFVNPAQARGFWVLYVPIIFISKILNRNAFITCIDTAEDQNSLENDMYSDWLLWTCNVLYVYV